MKKIPDTLLWLARASRSPHHRSWLASSERAPNQGVQQRQWDRKERPRDGRGRGGNHPRSRWHAGAEQGLSAKIGRVRATIEIVAKLVGASRLYRSERS